MRRLNSVRFSGFRCDAFALIRVDVRKHLSCDTCATVRAIVDANDDIRGVERRYETALCQTAHLWDRIIAHFVHFVKPCC